MENDSLILISIFITHLFLTIWSMLVGFSGIQTFYNSFFFVSLLWSVHETKSSAPTLTSLAINLMAIVMDAVLVGMFWWDGRGYRFVLGTLAYFANMLYRLLTSLIIYQIWLKRQRNETQINFGSVTRDLTEYFKFGRTGGQTTSPPPTNGTPNP